MRKIKAGDVFYFVIENIGFCFGQVVDKSELFVVVFDYVSSSLEDFDKTALSSNNVLLASRVTDAKFYHKHWVVIDNMPVVLGKEAMPIHKINISLISLTLYIIILSWII